MCFPALISAIGLGGGAAAGATAAGAAAGAATAGAATAGAGLTLTKIGTLLGVGGSLAQGIAGAQAARAQEAAINDRAATERRLAAIEENRTRMRFASAIGQQRAELAARGVQLDSPTSLLLGRAAAEEMSFAAQEVRSRGAATQAELSASARIARADRVSSILKGVTYAADSLLSAAPDLWPGLYDPEARRQPA